MSPPAEVISTVLLAALRSFVVMDCNDSKELPSMPTVEEIRNNIFTRLQEEKKRLETLPQSSKYVSHRMRVVNRATDIMNLSTKQQLKTQEDDELMALLKNLSL